MIVPRFKHTAVARNLLKRRLREIARTELLPAIAIASIAPVDVLVRARPETYDANFEQLRAQITGATGRILSLAPART